MIFLDNASTTQIYPEALKELEKYSYDMYYNPSALYSPSISVSNAINDVRKLILRAMSAGTNDKFVFTSGATEANNTIINNCARNKNAKMLFSVGEHPSVYNVALRLKNSGYNVQFINLMPDGTLDINHLKSLLDNTTCFVSFMHVSNETGAINDIATITKLIKSKCNALVHCDGVQAFMKMPVNVAQYGIDFYTISAHKFHGPKGIGGFFVKNGINVKPYLVGGGQESNVRSGTENVPAIMAMGKAIEIALPKLANNLNNVRQLDAHLNNRLSKYVAANVANKSPYISTFCFSGVRAETLLYMLQDKGYLVGNGSACSSKHKDNRVLNAMGVDAKCIEGAIRISLCENNTIDQINGVADAILQSVEEYKKRTNGGVK